MVAVVVCSHRTMRQLVGWFYVYVRCVRACICHHQPCYTHTRARARVYMCATVRSRPAAKDEQRLKTNRNVRKLPLVFFAVTPVPTQRTSQELVPNTTCLLPVVSERHLLFTRPRGAVCSTVCLGLCPRGIFALPFACCIFVSLAPATLLFVLVTLVALGVCAGVDARRAAEQSTA